MDDYYINQAGSGLGGFSGARYQKGDGFFGRILSGGILPIIKRVLPYLSKQAFSTAADIATDVSQGEKFGQSFKKRLKSTAGRVEDDAMAKVRQLTGSGKRKRRVCKRKPVKKCVKRRKTRRRRAPKKKATDFL